MTVDEILQRFGLHPTAEQLDHVRDLLAVETRLEREGQGSGDTEVMHLYCVQLFNAGVMSDVLVIWRAKSSSWDASCSIDVWLLCGRGLAETKAYLSMEGSDEAARALDHICQCEAAGDFADFSADRQTAA